MIECANCTRMVVAGEDAHCDGCDEDYCQVCIEDHSCGQTLKDTRA